MFKSIASALNNLHAASNLSAVWEWYQIESVNGTSPNLH